MDFRCKIIYNNTLNQKLYISYLYLHDIYVPLFLACAFSDACIDAVKCSEYPILSVLDQVAPRIPL